MRIQYTPTNSNYQNNEDDALRLPYFSLKNDNDFAYVRFMESSLENLDIQRTHRIEFKTKEDKTLYPNVSCIRENLSDVNDMSCPFCNANIEAKNVLFVKMLVYSNGEIKPCIWQKPWGFINELKTLMNDYGDLTKCIFKVTRSGAKGDKQTKYGINYMPNQSADTTNFVIPEAVYETFKNFDSAKACCWNKTADEMKTYVERGSFFIQSESHNSDSFAQTANEVNTTPDSTGYMVANAIDEELPFDCGVTETPVANTTQNNAPSNVASVVNSAPRRPVGNFPWQTNNAPIRQ